MAKGLGAIMAEVEIAQQNARIARGEAVLCPICGNVMEADGGSYFCYATVDSREVPHPCVTTTRNDVYEAFVAQYTGRWPEDDFQGQTLAAVVDAAQNPPVILLELRTVRGPNAKTNLRLFLNGNNPEEVPSLIKKLGWTFMDWVPE